MNNNSPIATASASGGFVFALVTLLVWGLSLVDITVPASVATAMMAILTPFVHICAIRFGFDPAQVQVKNPPTPSN
jgi:hypothetical protein